MIYWTNWAEILASDTHNEVFQNISLLVPWESFWMQAMGLTWPAKVWKVQKLIGHHIWGNFNLLLKFEKISSTGSDFAQKSGQFHRKIEARLPKFPKFQMFAKFTSNMGPNQFLNFLDLCRPSKAHRLGPKVLPWDQRRYILEYLIMSIRCQNFSSIGSLDQKFGIFSLGALKSTP